MMMGLQTVLELIHRESKSFIKKVKLWVGRNLVYIRKGLRRAIKGGGHFVNYIFKKIIRFVSWLYVWLSKMVRFSRVPSLAIFLRDRFKLLLLGLAIIVGGIVGGWYLQIQLDNASTESGAPRQEISDSVEAPAVYGRWRGEEVAELLANRLNTEVNKVVFAVTKAQKRGSKVYLIGGVGRKGIAEGYYFYIIFDEETGKYNLIHLGKELIPCATAKSLNVDFWECK